MLKSKPHYKMFRQWHRKCFLIVFLCCGAFIVLKIWRSSKLESIQYHVSKPVISKTVTINIDNKLIKKSFEKETVFVQATKFSQHSCPACFGSRMCSEIDAESMMLNGHLPNTHQNRISWKKGSLASEKVLISSPVFDEWNKFDEFVCRNASQLVPCDVPVSVRKTVLAADSMLLLQRFRNLYEVLDGTQMDTVLPICATGRLMDELQKAFDDDYDGYLSKEEQIMMLTSLLMHPGYVVLKLQGRTNMNMPIPNLVGACDRTVVMEGGLTPLKAFLQEPFDVRAGLAVQVLQIVEDFEDEDPHWYFLYTEFSLDTIMVTQDGEVIVVDLDDVVIVDKALFPTGFRRLRPNKELCNEVCFQKATQDIFYSVNSSATCSQVAEYSQLMYAIVCKNILSDIKEHKAAGFFNFDGHKVHKESQEQGLLHMLPEKDKETVEDLLRECVQETGPDGRRKAVMQLRDILENHIDSDDDEDDIEDDGVGDNTIHLKGKKNEEEYNDAEEETDDYIGNKVDLN